MKKPFKIALALVALLILTLANTIIVGAIHESPDLTVGDDVLGVPSSHTVTLYDRGDPFASVEVPNGATLSELPTPTREGYKLVGWRTDSDDGTPFEPSTPITKDTDLHAVYELLPPAFDISSLSFTYDSHAHTLAFSSVSHPLLTGGILSYEWYKDGTPIGAYGSSLSVSKVSDSGEYSCRLVFSVGGDVTEITTPPITVRISKCEIPLPTLAPVYYTGDAQSPSLYDSGYYTVDRTPHTLAGTYPVAITLKDHDNYTFSDTDKPTVTVDMTILQAENFWVVPPTVSDVYTSFSPTPSAMSRFGTTTFLYSRDGVEYTATAPTAPGEYLMRAEVSASENYSALICDPVRFKVIAEAVVGIAAKSPAQKMTYYAFEQFDPTGLLIGVTYNSGRYEEIGAEMLDITYQQADSFRYRDSGVIISYGGSSVLLRTTVLRADYDLTGIDFPDIFATYNASLITPDYLGTLPIGADGIPLVAYVTGGGVDVGVYTVTLSFYTDSDNYNTPSPINATLTVEPCVATVTWTGLTFVYDGSLKLPEAYYLDLYGRKVTLTPTGAHSFAGQYTATVTTPDPNYTLANPTVDYEIQKADYDMSGALWQGGGEVYDGMEKRVYLTGLPTGVTVVGYVNSTAVNAGAYTATAALSYDTANYNPPIAPEYLWRVLPAVYPTDTFEFFDNITVFDGEAHYPLIKGEMPVGIDGTPLEYSFSASATHVSDGRVKVEISFSTKSPNYTPPPPSVRYVEITPREITVKWENVEFRYTGAPLLPTATANECEITVHGASVTAGQYTATAVTKDTDYKVKNSTCTYVILKAENEWTSSLAVPDVFFGTTPTPTATAKAGEVIYTYYSDAECTSPIDSVPDTVGIYYVRAYTEGDLNHEPIESSPVRFEIIAIIPVALVVTPDKAEYTAFDTVTFTASLLNNDGSYTAIDPTLVRVKYQSGDTMRYGDTRVTFSYADLTASAAVTVIKRDYDLSTLVWSSCRFTYNGAPHTVTLSGLPDSVTVREYVGVGFVNAGEYTVSAVLDYDSANYNPPVISPITVTVDKQTVPLPVIGSAEYNGAPNTATVTPSPLYTVTPLPSATLTGAYPITLTLTDPENYTFGTSATATVYFHIEPRRLTVKVSDFDLYLFESEVSPTFEITDGTLVDGDTLTPAYRVSDGKIYVDFGNKNYDITVIPGTLHRHKTLSSEANSLLLFIILIILLLLLVTVAVFVARRRIRCRAYTPVTPSDPLPEPDAPPTDTPTDDPPTTVVDAEYADAAITNALAKDLIRRDDDVVTDGSRRGIVNVDTLSRSFSAGERVDINALKSHSLIPYDTAYIKVLARGIIDKPLYVYANDFSLSAVKMIALSGGKAVKVNSVIRKKE